MIKWFKHKLLSWALEVDEEPKEVGRDGRSLGSQCIRIDVYRGVGGLAVETVIYNQRTDTNYIGFYIVQDDQNLGNELSKIITAESMKAL
jgi:hypothetical protein